MSCSALAEWESNLEQLAPPKTPIPEVKKKAAKPKAAKARESPAQEAESPSRFQRGSAASSSTPERPLEYGGEHILEVFGLSVDRGTKELEDLAEVLGDVGALSPAIRYQPRSDFRSLNNLFGKVWIKNPLD